MRSGNGPSHLANVLIFITAILTVGLSQIGCSKGHFEKVKVDDESSSSNNGDGNQNQNPPLIENALSYSQGEFKSFAAAVTEMVPDLQGKALMIRSSKGETEVHVSMANLTPNTTYMAHVHNLPCSISNGGGHYKIDPSIDLVIEQNEIWPMISTDANGIGKGYARVNHLARSEAQSIVVHGTGGVRIACVDLESAAATNSVSGAFVTTQIGLDRMFDINGRAYLRRDNSTGQTVVKVQARGLVADTQHMVHVHDDTCANAMSAHYKIIPDIAAVEPSNEIWPLLTANALGEAVSQIWVDHVARPEALSIVVHDPADAARIACLDLNFPGEVLPTDAAFAAGANYSGSASLSRDANGISWVSLNLNGFAPLTQYMAHVHDLPCEINGGGGHYKRDYAIAEVIESNEMWIMFTTNAEGRIQTTKGYNHLARPEAQSLVVHDPVDSSRIACVNL